ncbi:MAG: efflux RND transporter periplasmic adaptor subunit [Thermodesulfobacteriota bacterium]
MKRVFIRILAILVIVAIVIGLTMALRKAKQQTAAAPVWTPRPAPVETASVTEGKLARTFRYLARLEAAASAEIAPRLSARIIALAANEGDTVDEGDLLARLDDRDIRARIDAAQADLAAAKARLASARADREAARSHLAYARLEYDRNQNLFERNAVSEAALEASQNRLDEALAKTTRAEEAIRSAQEEIKAREARLAEARAALADTEIRADSSGAIRKRYAEVGDMAMPGKPIYAMMDISSYRLGFDLVQKDLEWVRPGRPVRIHWPVPPSEDAREAAVTRIFPSMESDQTVRAEIDLFCRCPERMKVGSLIPVEVVAAKGRGLIVPGTALAPTPEGGHIVYAIRDGRLKAVPVRITLRHEDRVLVEGELSPGEPVAVGEYLQWVRMHDGMAVSS